MARYDELFQSPKGFWPNLDQEPFYKCQTPPWEVPKKRKSGGTKSRYNALSESMYELGSVQVGHDIVGQSFDVAAAATRMV